MKVGVLFASMLEKIGLDPADEKYKDVLSVGVEVDHETEKALNGLLSIDAAKNNPELKKYYYANAYDGLERDLIKRAENIGDADFLERIKSEKSTGKKQGLLLDKMEELRGSANNSGDKETEKALKEQIKTLNADLSKYKDGYIHKDELTKKEQEFETERLNSIIESTFAGQKWTEAIAPNFRSVVGKSALNEKLSELGASIVRDGNTVKLVQASNPEMDYFDASSKSIKFEQLVNELMTTNKFIAVSKPGTENNSHQNYSGASTSGTSKINNATQTKLEQSMAAQGLIS